MPKKDFSQIAFDVVQRATGEKPKRVTTPKQEAGRRTAEERRALAVRGAAGRKNAPADKAGASQIKK